LAACASLILGTASAFAAAPKNTSPPIVSPTSPNEGQLVSGTTGKWTNEPKSFSYQWRRCNATGGECVNIAAAIEATYLPGTPDDGHALILKVTATNGEGSGEAFSTATSPVRAKGSAVLYESSNGFGIAAGSDGNLWFPTSGNHIDQITPSGTITKFTPPEKTEAKWITAGPDKNLWFTGQDLVGKITTSGAVTEYALPAGSKPEGIATGPDSNLWFAESGTKKIGKITTSGTITEYSVGAEPKLITAGPDGNLWFTEKTADKVSKINTEGVVLAEYSLPESSGPTGIVGGPDGNVWVTEYLAGKIAKVSTSGVITEYSLTAGKPRTIAVGPDGNLWFVILTTKKVGRITTSGTITEYAVGTTFLENGIAAGPDGNMWFTSTSAVGNVLP
jgi:streptogramin lyase